MDMKKNSAREKAMIALFNAVAHAQYLQSTRKSFEELQGYLTKNKMNWANVVTESDLASIEACISAARDVALCVVDAENFRRFFDSMDNTILKS